MLPPIWHPKQWVRHSGPFQSNGWRSSVTNRSWPRVSPIRKTTPAPPTRPPIGNSSAPPKATPEVASTITADALHCQRKIARTIAEKGGDYLLQVKGNQPHLEKQALKKASTSGAPFFEESQVGHGRVDNRALHHFATDGMAMDFPFARSLMVVRSRRTEKRSGKSTVETRYYISSLEPEDRTPEQWLQLIRGHWAGFENRNHWRRDALMGEDRSRSRNRSLLTNLALIRNGLFRVLNRCFPGDSIPVIRERIQAKPCLAFRALEA